MQRNQIQKQLTDYIREKLKIPNGTDNEKSESVMKELTKKNGPLFKFADVIIKSAKKAGENTPSKLKPYQLNYLQANQHILDIVDVTNLLDLVSSKIQQEKDKKSSKLIHELDTLIRDSSEPLAESTQKIIAERYKAVDQRWQEDEDKTIRRLDSLARILTTSQRYSVCTAVCFQQGRLIIGMNASSQKELPKIEGFIINRLKLLTKFIRECDDINVDDFEEIIHIKASELAKTLKSKENGGCAIGSDTLEQAIYKFAHAIIIDKETFLEENRNIFRSETPPHLLLLPSIESNREAHLSITSHNHEGEKTTKKYKINSVKKLVSITSLHAEQLIVHHLMEKEYTDDFSNEKPLKIGISMLCCKSCEHNLKKAPFPVKIRGGHDTFDPQTTNIISSEDAPKHTKTPKASKTAARPSPKKTPTKNVSRKLIFDKEQPDLKVNPRRLFHNNHPKDTSEKQEKPEHSSPGKKK